MNLKISKPKTRPIQIEPWFFKYLNEGQIKVVAAILSHADMKDRKSNSFPSNRTIAFYCGFGDIKEKSKAYDKYKSLSTEEEKIKFKNKRIKTAIITVANIKKSLEDIGLLKREYSGQKGKQVVYMTLDLEWKKEKYIQEHNEFFNNIEPVITEEQNDEFIKNELAKIQKLQIEGNISKDDLANRLSKLAYSIKEEKNSFDIPTEDIEKVADYILTTSKVKDRIEKGKITNKEAYKKSIAQAIRRNEFNGAKDYYDGLIVEEKNTIFNTLKHGFEYQENKIPYKNQFLDFMDIELKENIFIASYKSEFGQIYNFPISYKKLNYYILTPASYSKINREFLENYNDSLLKYLEKYKTEKIQENTS